MTSTAGLVERITPPSTDGAVRRATSRDLATVAATLGAAFDDDPLFGHLVRAGGGRRAALERLFGTLVKTLALPHRETYLTAGGGGAAVWLPPGETDTGPLDQVRLLPAMIAAGGWRGLPRFLRTLGVMDQHHPHQPHAYLMLLGVRPERQGAGIGSELLREVLDRCDRDGIPAYLEASSPRNARLYERHAFVATDAVWLPDGGPPMWPMWRPPASRSG